MKIYAHIRYKDLIVILDSINNRWKWHNRDQWDMTQCPENFEGTLVGVGYKEVTFTYYAKSLEQ